MAVGLFFLVPCIALADGVSPILNLFHRGTWLPAFIVTVAIVLFESALLRWRIREVPFGTTLWRSFLINLASSFAGSAVLLGFGRNSFFIWDSTPLVLPLFLITLVTEIPLLYVFYKGVPLTWKRACILGLGINSASYFVVFLGEIVLLIGWLGYAGYADRNEPRKWNHPELMAHSRGVIYATTMKRHTVTLRMFDLKNARWSEVANCPPLDPYTWDIQGYRCAFVGPRSGVSQGGTIVIASLPGFSVVREISLARVVEVQPRNRSGWQGVSDLALSPDTTKVAVLFHVSDAVAYKDESSYYILGDKCTLAVFDVDTGRELVRSVRRASGRGLCWLPDSSGVVFSSFEDDSVYDPMPTDPKGSVGYGVAYGNSDDFKQGLFSLTLKTYQVRPFSEGESPELSMGSRHIFIKDGGSVRVLDEKGTELSKTSLSRLGSFPAVPSPDGSLVLANLRRQVPFHAGNRLTVIDLKNSGLRHILAEDFIYRYRWVAE
jgi:hypothetical protein